MKNQLKNLIPILVLFATLIFSSCQKDLYEDKVTDSAYNYPNAPFKSKMVNIHDVPNIENYINFNGSNPANKTGELTNELTDAIFAENSVIETIDQEKNKNYSIAFIYDDTPKEVFYNLIVNVFPNGEQKAHIIKYSCSTASYENFKLHNFNYKYYDGITEMNTFNVNRNNDDDPCPKILIPSSTTPNSNGPATGSTSNTSTTTSTFNTAVIGYNTPATSGVTSVTIGGTTYYTGGGVSTTTTTNGGTPTPAPIPEQGWFHTFMPYLMNMGRGLSNTGKTEDDPCPPETLPTGTVPINDALQQLTHLASLYTNPVLNKFQKFFLADHPEALSIIYTNLISSGAGADDRAEALILINAAQSFIAQNGNTIENQNLVNYILNFQIENPNLTFDQIIHSRTDFDDNLGDDDNNSIGNYDNTIYDDFNVQQTWPIILPVINATQFIGYGTPGIRRNCMDYAKAQIAVKGYQISNYYAPGQTFQIYKEQTGVNQAKLSLGLSYLHYALNHGIPVIVGIDDQLGYPINKDGTPGNPDLTTDHFIVIVGMGSNSNGNYFQFYDNASGIPSQGTNPLNLLYYNSTTGEISGQSQTTYAQSPSYHEYILTQIRKSKPQ